MRSTRLTGYDKALFDLRLQTVQLSLLVQELLAKAVETLNKDSSTIDWRAKDNVIDSFRDKIVNRSFEMMSLQQLRPKDLRWILGYQRIAQELERVADYACDVVELNELKRGQKWPEQIYEMAGHFLKMVDFTVDILKDDKNKIDNDLNEEDDVLDNIYALLQKELVGGSLGMNVNSGLVLILARTIERMGDHTVNIAEMLLYIETGKRRLSDRTSN